MSNDGLPMTNDYLSVTNLLIIAGEVSGDLHGASLITELKKIDKNINIYGIGGDRMRAAGMELKYHIDKISQLYRRLDQ